MGKFGRARVENELEWRYEALKLLAAYEALARGPVGSPLESPAALFATARIAGRLTELEWACRAAALQGALDANLGSQVSLFINCEPGQENTFGGYNQQVEAANVHSMRVAVASAMDLAAAPQHAELALPGAVGWVPNRFSLGSLPATTNTFFTGALGDAPPPSESGSSKHPRTGFFGRLTRKLR